MIGNIHIILYENFVKFFYKKSISYIYFLLKNCITIY